MVVIRFLTFSQHISQVFPRKLHLIVFKMTLLQSIDKKQVSAFVLLNLSAAFDTIDHSILMDRLNSYFGTEGNVLQLNPLVQIPYKYTFL